MFLRLIVALSLIQFMTPPAGPSAEGPVQVEPHTIDKPNVLRDGAWVERGMKNIMGAGTDTTITIRLMPVRNKLLADDRTVADWTVTYTQVEHFRVGSRGPKITTSGPYRVEVDEAQSTLTIRKEGARDSKYTFKFSEDGSTLVMPAFVEVEPGRFLFVNEGKRFEVKCEHDPRKVPAGKAWMSGITAGQMFYSYEEMPRSLDWSRDKSTRYLRVLERVKDGGYLIERGRLIWDDWGSPRFERILSTGQPRSHKQHIKLWYAEKNAR